MSSAPGHLQIPVPQTVDHEIHNADWGASLSVHRVVAVISDMHTLKRPVGPLHLISRKPPRVSTHAVTHARRELSTQVVVHPSFAVARSAQTITDEQADGNGNGNGSDSRPGDGEAILTAIKGNGAGSIEGPIPGISTSGGDGSGKGAGDGGGGNSKGSGGGDGNANNHYGWVIVAGLLAAAAGLYAGYQIIQALRNKYQHQPDIVTSKQERYVLAFVLSLAWRSTPEACTYS